MEVLELTKFSSTDNQVLLNGYSESLVLFRDLGEFLVKNRVEIKRLGKRSNSDPLKQLGILYKNLFESLPIVGNLFINPKNRSETEFVPTALHYFRHRFNPIWISILKVRIEARAYDIISDLKVNHKCQTKEVILNGTNVGSSSQSIIGVVENFKRLRASKVWLRNISGGAFILAFNRDRNSGKVICQIRLIMGCSRDKDLKDLLNMIDEKWIEINAHSGNKTEPHGIQVSHTDELETFKTPRGKWDILLINRILRERGKKPEQWHPFGCLSYSSNDYGSKYTTE